MATSSAPTPADLAAAAERTLAALGTEGQVEARWERRLDADGTRDEMLVTVTALHDGRAGRATTFDVDDAHLARTARTAALRARQARAWPAGPLPEAMPGRPHDGFDARLVDLDATAAVARARAAAGDDLDVDWSAGLCRMVTVSTRGVVAAEQRSHVVCRVSGARPGGRRATVTVAGVGSADVAAAAAETRALLGEGATSGRFVVEVPAGRAVLPGGAVLPGRTAVPGGARVPGGAPVPTGAGEAVVLGPEAVAAVLDQLRAAFGIDLALGGGPLHDRRGAAVAATVVDLLDAADHPGTLPRSYDAEGVPRRPVTLIAGGVARGQVHDASTAARAGAGATSTGHATRALTPAPYPDHLVLGGGEAEDVTALCEPVTEGLFLPALSAHFERTPTGRRHETVGGARIHAGRPVAAPARLVVEIDALAVLASVDALTAAQRLVPLRGHAPGGIGAAVVPALRASAGVRVVGCPAAR